MMPMINLKFAVQTAIFVLIFTYNAGRGHHIDDPDPEVTWTPPSNPNSFQEFTDGANYSGLLYAGALEFNWIVDIRNEDGGQDDWAVGNLVTFYHVLTTCKGIRQLQKPGGKGVNRYDPETGWTIEQQTEFTTSIRVYYCLHYLWENKQEMPTDQDGATSGARSISKIIKHPKCFYQNLIFDAAIIVMIRGIAPIEPRIGYMPTGFDYQKEKTLVTIKLDPNQPIDYKSPICYVAAYGRNYKNHKEFYVLDYKIKIRVYITKWKDCGDVWKYICKEDDQDCASSVDTVKQDGGVFRYCFRPRAKVGTVCDRDRGAPVVCNGMVIGLVIRGAAPMYCNNLYKIPFVAERIDRYPEYFDQAIAYNVHPVPTKRSKKPGQAPGPSGFSGASAHGIMGLLYVACSAILSSAIN